MYQAADTPTRERIAAHLATLRAVVGGERSPIGRAWNHDMTRQERAFWARAAGLGPTDSRNAACREWQGIDATAQAAIQNALARAADRAVFLLKGGAGRA